MISVRFSNSFAALCLLPATLLSTAHAAVISVGPGDFPASSSLITFSGVPDSTEVNGLTVGGVQFGYSLGNGHLIIDGGPGITNNIDPPNVVSIGDNTGVLSLTLPGPSSMFGYGYAILNTIPIMNATTIALYSGATNVGTLSYDGVPDPLFTGGFAGIQSTIPFDSVQLSFDAALAPAFALDNIRIAATIPEPSTLLLVLGGAALLLRPRNKLR